jgi:glutathione S-transferase
VSRLSFVVAGVEFDDVRFDVSAWAAPTWTGTTKQAWADFKPLTPHGHLPVLDVHGDGSVMLSQSRAIERFIARSFGLFGNDNVEAALIDATCETVRDLYEPWVAIFNVPRDEQAAKRHQFIAELTPKLLGLEKQAARGAFLVGDRITLADVSAFAFLHELRLTDAAAFATAVPPSLQALVNKIEALPTVSAYLKTRPIRPLI